jgi:hypothetical protein
VIHLSSIPNLPGTRSNHLGSALGPDEMPASYSNEQISQRQWMTASAIVVPSACAVTAGASTFATPPRPIRVVGAILVAAVALTALCVSWVLGAEAAESAMYWAGRGCRDWCRLYSRPLASLNGRGIVVGQHAPNADSRTVVFNKLGDNGHVVSPVFVAVPGRGRIEGITDTWSLVDSRAHCQGTPPR